MSTLVVLQALLGVAVLIAIVVVYSNFQVRRGNAALLAHFAKMISAIERVQSIQPELVDCARRIESDASALQKIALQIETAVASLQDGVSSSIRSAADRQTRATEGLLDHIDLQEERLAKTLENISDSLRFQGDQPAARQHRVDIDHSQLRREVLRQGPEVRFSVLKQWIAVNALAILHRAARGWSTANDLIANIPAYLEPEAEILNDSVLLIGAHNHPEKLAIPLRTLDPTSEFVDWFDAASEGHTRSPIPAVLVLSSGHFTLVSKGTNSATGLPAA
jgi:hypothetical protein